MINPAAANPRARQSPVWAGLVEIHWDNRDGTRSGIALGPLSAWTVGWRLIWLSVKTRFTDALGET